MVQKESKSASLDALKTLLLAPEEKRLSQVESRLNDPMTRAKEISRSLPDAISLSITTGDNLSRVIQPVIDDSLKESVRKNPKAIADAIYPALGPGIRKAISSTLMGMIQSMNQVLNHSLSIQGLKWRFEAVRTGKPFAEVVMLHTLLFQVEQMFLIHSDSGLVLQHVVAKDVIIQDPDLVSGMLTAIQDFVRDSFHSETEDNLETLRMGSDRSVWVEKGEQAFIAAVVKGTPPVELRTSYRELIEEIHLKAGSALTDFDGDTLPFSIFRESMNAGLQFQEKANRKKVSPLMYCLLALLVALPSYWGYTLFKTRENFARQLARIKDQKGVIVLSAQRDHGKYRITGLRDPLVRNPLAMLGKDAEKIQAVWQPFYSLDPEFVLQRATKILAPPDSVTLTLDNDTLSARGKAGHHWIKSFGNQTMAIPGITGYDASQMVDLDMQGLVRGVADLEKIKIYFEYNSTDLVAGQETTLARAVETIRTINRLTAVTGRVIPITILGHTDSSGTADYNLKLSRDRADKILALCVAKGIDPGSLKAAGVAAKLILKPETQEEDRQYNRAVTFEAAEKGALE